MEVSRTLHSEICPVSGEDPSHGLCYLFIKSLYRRRECTPFSGHIPDFPGSCPPDIKARDESAGNHNEKDGNVAPHLVMEETSEPRSGGPSNSIDEHERSKDPSISLTLKKIRSDNGRKCRRSSVSHAEEDPVKVWKSGRRVNGKYNKNYHATNRAGNSYRIGNLPSDFIR